MPTARGSKQSPVSEASPGAPGTSARRWSEQRGRERRSDAAFLCIDEGAEDSVHAGKVTLTPGAKPFDDISIDAQVNRSLAGRQDDARGFPEILAEGRGFRCIGTRWIQATLADRFDLTK